MAADIEYHPHQITYFNAFVGGLNGAHNSTEQYRKTLPGFEALDYWGSSIRNCVEWANAELPNGARLTFGVGDHIGKFYSIRKGLRCDCFDGERVSCGDSYVISLERLVFFKPCDYWVRMSGTAVFEVRIDGVRLAAVFKVPGRFNLCHKAPSLERVDPLRLSDGIHDVTLRVRSELCARDEPISLFVRRSGEHDWISWNDFLVKNPGAQEAIAAQGAVPATLEPGCDMRFTLPSAALRHLIPGKAPVLTFVVAVGRAENILLSNTVDVEFE
jgi:hypothetical protein